MRQVDERFAWAQAQVRACQRIALRYFYAGVRVEQKPDRTPVTIADRTIEERLRKAIERAFPGEAIIGEEFGASEAAGSTYWTIDPIDGTRAFSRGLPSWGILLGRVEKGEAVLAACAFPAVDVFAGVAPGIRAHEQRGSQRLLLPRARPVALDRAVIFHGGARWWLRSRYAQRFRRLISTCYLERAYGDGFGYLWALRGHVDLVMDIGVKLWDLAPLAALARATGRVLADCSARPNFTGPECLFGHPRLVRRVAQVLTNH